MRRNVRVEIKELGAAAWSDVTSSCSSLALNMRKGFGSLGAGCNVSSLTLELEADSLASAVLFHSTARQVRIQVDGTYVFDGYTEGDASVDSTADITKAWVSLTAHPWSACFETSESEEDLTWDHVKICDPGDQEHSLVHLMVDAMYDGLAEPYRTIPLPMADAVFADGERLPATYANFLIMNGAVLYPTYSQSENDRDAAVALSKAFPGYEIVGIDCLPLIKQHGSLHCITMQYPKGVLKPAAFTKQNR